MPAAGRSLPAAPPEIQALAETLSIPVTSTLMGLGCFPGTHPLSLGMLGMHGTYWANMAVGHCDLLIAIGARFDDRVTGKCGSLCARGAHHSYRYRSDLHPEKRERGNPDRGRLQRRPDQARIIWSRSGPHRIGIRSAFPGSRRSGSGKASHPLTYRQEGEKIKPQFVVEKIYEVTQGQAIITTEVGQNQMWAAQFYHFDRPHSFITSGGLGVMGYGFPAAIGAQIACPDRMVFDIAGDGSIQMNIQELATAVANNVPVKIAILNNGYLGMVRQWQELFYDKRYAQTALKGNPDFVKLAEAYGAVGLRATDRKKWSRSSKKPCRSPSR